MRKTSHDGGDSTSITSGVENEMKKSALKPKKSSLKRKAPNYNQESDDTVIEPLLQKDKEKELQSAKFFGKGKTDSLQNKDSESKAKTTATTGFCGTTESLLSFKESDTSKTSSVVAPLHNYMNTNVFNTHDNAKANITTKSHILVEIDSSKQGGYTPSPLIFTTAKIHTDAKTKQMEPVLVTPVPILSTIEVSVSKRGNITTNEKKISNGSSVMNPIYTPMPLSKGKEEKIGMSTSSSVNKDLFGKIITVASAGGSANVTTDQNSMKVTLPCLTSNSLLMKSNTKGNEEDLKEVRKEQTLSQTMQLQSKPLNVDIFKNNVSVKTMPSSEKTIDIPSTLSQISNDTPKIGENDISKPITTDSTDLHHIASNSKTPSSKTSVGLSNPANIISSVGNKQLQRQKPTTEEKSDKELKNKPNSVTSSAKTQYSSQLKIIDNVSTKDFKLSNVSANNTHDTNSKSLINSSAKTISETTSELTTVKPTAVDVTSSTAITTVASTVSKPLMVATTNTSKTISAIATSANVLSNENKSNAPTLVSASNAKSSVGDTAKISQVTKSIVMTNCPEVTSLKTQPKTSISQIKTIPESTSNVNVSTAGISSVLSTSKSKASSVNATKPSPVVATTISVTEASTEVNSTIKSVVTKAPSGITSVKPTSVATSANAAKSNIGQISSSKLPISTGINTAVKTPEITSVPKTTASSVNAVSLSKQESVKKEAKDVSKTTSAVTSEKPSKVSSTAATPGLKSPNNNSSQTLGGEKQSITPNSKTETASVSKTAAESSSTVTASAVKTPQSSSTTTMKESASSAKKSAATKIPSNTTKSPTMTTTSKSLTGTSTKVSSEAATAPTSLKKPGTLSTKTGPGTTSSKTPSATTLSKASDVSTLSSTTAATIKPTTTSTTQVSANKSANLAGTSVPSSTPVLRPSESIKKSTSKSSENNKDGKVSKA